MTTRQLPGPSGSPHLTPKLARRLAIMGALVLVAMGVLVLRLWFLQVIGGAEFERQATDNRVRTVSVEAPRGIILDRTGKVELVRNRAGENVVIRPQDLPEARRERVIEILSRAVGVPERRIRAQLTKAEKDGPTLESVVVAEDVEPTVQAFVRERRRQLPGVTLERTYVREYPQKQAGNAVASHVLGYTGQIPAEQVDAYRKLGYALDERVGLSGIELQYQDYLRGAAGQFRVEVDATGEQTDRGIVAARPPRPGRNLVLSLDVPTQKTLEDQLRARVEISPTSNAAAGVALDPETGEILAMASYPTYDSDAFARNQRKRIAAFFSDPHQALNNRAIGGLYPAASTFKAFTSLAALQAGFLKTDELVGSPGEIVLYNQKWKNFDGVSLGEIDVRKALMYSADTFFDSVSSRFYEDYLARGRTLQQDWANRFGFGDATGVDLPGENGGLVPTPEWKKSLPPNPRDPNARVWLPGDNIQMGIGQKDLLVTPLQAAVGYAAIANGGKVVTPTLVRRVQNLDGSDALDPTKTRPPRATGVSERNLQAVKDGLYMVTNNFDGTASGVFGLLPEEFKAAGKTGTAENAGPDHSWFVGYAPYFAPKIVVAIVVENGGQGANAAAPAVCRVMSAYLRFDGAQCGSGARAN